MHVPVMTKEVIEHLHIKPGQWYLDGTFGRGGHTRAMLEQGAKVVAFDMDPQAIEFAHSEFAEAMAANKFKIFHANFADLDKNLKNTNWQEEKFAGALFDLGLSSNQLEESKRGFSFSGSEPLDMRMDQRLGVTAADLINALPEKHLKDMFWDFAQETRASRIAHEIVEQRESNPFKTTDQLVAVIEKVKGPQRGKLHPATKVFMALRMAVNTELDNLDQLLNSILDWLQPEARLVFISFHEGEDRRVKQRFNHFEELGLINQVTSKPLAPTEDEVNQNPRSRSARLRVAQKIPSKQNK